MSGRSPRPRARICYISPASQPESQMRRRSFLAALPAAALAGPAFATSRQENPNRDRLDVHGGDRIDGATWAGRSTVWGLHGAAATAHPLATQAAIDIL